MSQKWYVKVTSNLTAKRKTFIRDGIVWVWYDVPFKYSAERDPPDDEPEVFSSRAEAEIWAKEYASKWKPTEWSLHYV